MAVFEISCGKKQADRQTDKRRSKTYPVTTVDVRNNRFVLEV